MSRPNKNKIMERKIFLFLFEETKSFFLNDTTQESGWKYYDGHYRGCYAATRDAFLHYKEKKMNPPMYQLDTINGTEPEAFQRKIEWAKYFIEHGYRCLMGSAMEEIIDEFDPNESEFYATIRNVSMEKLCAPDRNLMAEYRNSSKHKRTENSFLPLGTERISLLVKTEEHQKYKKTAKEYGVPMSEYILDCVRFGGVFRVDTDFLEQYTREIDRCNQLLSGMIATYLITGEYYPADICRMDEIADRIVQNNEEVKREIIRLCRQLRRMKDGGQLNIDPLQ